jgi:hypothetical protein
LRWVGLKWKLTSAIAKGHKWRDSGSNYAGSIEEVDPSVLPHEQGTSFRGL